MKSLLGLFCLFIFSSMSWADIVIQFEPRAYLFHQVKEKIEHDTPYDIDFPFVDEARIKKFLPSKLSLDECLNWMILYFESENHLTLQYTTEEHQIYFQKASPLAKKELQEILKTPLTLNGNDWTILEAIEAANQQIKTSIVLPFSDRSKLKADYHYNCTLGEFLDEIKSYWKRENGYHIHASISNSDIVFFKGQMANKNNKVVPMIRNLKQNISNPITQDGVSE